MDNDANIWHEMAADMRSLARDAYNYHLDTTGYMVDYGRHEGPERLRKYARRIAARAREITQLREDNRRLCHMLTQLTGSSRVIIVEETGA